VEIERPPREVSLWLRLEAESAMPPVPVPTAWAFGMVPPNIRDVTIRTRVNAIRDDLLCFNLFHSVWMLRGVLAENCI